MVDERKGNDDEKLGQWDYWRLQWMRGMHSYTSDHDR